MRQSQSKPSSCSSRPRPSTEVIITASNCINALSAPTRSLRRPQNIDARVLTSLAKIRAQRRGLLRNHDFSGHLTIDLLTSFVPRPPRGASKGPETSTEHSKRRGIFNRAQEFFSDLVGGKERQMLLPQSSVMRRFCISLPMHSTPEVKRNAWPLVKSLASCLTSVGASSVWGRGK